MSKSDAERQRARRRRNRLQLRLAQIEIDEYAAIDRLILEEYLAEADALDFNKVEDAICKLIKDFCHGVTLTRRKSSVR